MPVNNRSILVVDNDALVLEGIRYGAEANGLDTELYTSGRKAIEAFRKNPLKYSMVVVDFEMPEMNGDEVLKEIIKIHPGVRAAIISGDVDAAAAVCFPVGIRHVFEKGLGVTRLLQLLLSNLDGNLVKPKSETEWRKRRDFIRETFGYAGQSGSLYDAANLVRKFANSKDTVLITGESGTGKEQAARSLHKFSGREQKPFVAVNCGAISSQLIESELFGHEKGSFTDASRTSPGKFLLADGGTIFLDEVGEMPVPLQVKLLRVLQEKTLDRVGSRSSAPIKVDVRVIAATNKNLDKQVEEGFFERTSIIV